MSELQQLFTDEVNKIRDKYFVDATGLTVINGNDNFEIAFAVDIDKIKNPL